MIKKNQPSAVDVKNTPLGCGLPKNQKLCRHCAEPIALEARICHHCGTSQTRFWALLPRMAVLSSIVLVALASVQLVLAREERIAAKQALNAAINAKNKAELAAEKAKKTEQYITNLNEKLREQILSMITISYMTLESRVAWSAHSQKVAKEIKAEMDSLLTYIYPDPKERAFWMENLERRVSGE